MKKKKSYAVLGLGRYGSAVARELVENGREVIAIDRDQKIVNDAAAFLPVCKCADITDPEVISQLGIGEIDTVIVCMASNFEAAVLAVTLCKEAGVQTVIAKCANEVHQKIMLRIGADQVVFPEYESGVRLAKNLLSSGFIDMISLSKDVSMVEIEVKDEWVGKSLVELNLRSRYSINVIAISKDGQLISSIDPTLPLEKGMLLFVLANTEKLQLLS